MHRKVTRALTPALPGTREAQLVSESSVREPDINSVILLPSLSPLYYSKYSITESSLSSQRELRTLISQALDQILESLSLPFRFSFVHMVNPLCSYSQSLLLQQRLSTKSSETDSQSVVVHCSLVASEREKGEEKENEEAIHRKNSVLLRKGCLERDRSETTSCGDAEREVDQGIRGSINRRDDVDKENVKQKEERRRKRGRKHMTLFRLFYTILRH